MFNAMMAQVTLPMEKCFQRNRSGRPNADTCKDAISNVWQGITGCLERLTHDAQIRCALEIATFKVEYVEESQGVRECHLSVQSALLARFEQSIDLVA